MRLAEIFSYFLIFINLWKVGFSTESLLGSESIQGVVVHPADPNIRLQGRYKILENGGRAFDAPGFAVNVGITGATEAYLILRSRESNTPNRFWVFVDGVRDASRDIDTAGATPEQPQRYLVASKLTTAYHELTVVKISEANFNVPNWTAQDNFLVFAGFVLDGGKTAPVSSLYMRSLNRRIEFIGDSITAGYCNLCREMSVPRGRVNYRSESFVYSWPYLATKELNASYHVSAWSGYGIVGGAGWMPAVYGRTLQSSPSSVWEFHRWVPHAVVINLGTNDRLHPRMKTPWDAQFIDIFRTFIMNISTTYSTLSSSAGTSPHFFLACGPMTDSYCPHVDVLLKEFSEGKKINATFLDHRGVPNDCCGHPGPTANVEMGKRTSDTISRVLGWS